MRLWSTFTQLFRQNENVRSGQYAKSEHARFALEGGVVGEVGKRVVSCSHVGSFLAG